MKLDILPAQDHADEIAALFSEYTAMLIEGDPAFKGYLEIQHYDEELRSLDAKYGVPFGRLYIARCDGETAGCIALRRIDRQRCEMKRLYVRPRFRGKRIGKALAEKIIADAREIGYARMLLDTLPFLHRAIEMYKNLGFREIPRYNDSPMKDAVYLQLDLRHFFSYHTQQPPDGGITKGICHSAG